MAGQLIGCVTLAVQDYDEAISYFSRKLGFEVVDDRDLSDLHLQVMTFEVSGKRLD
jgi:catechol 2,3-dioxygenase-like lactoylglutathione lyase family enzyme